MRSRECMCVIAGHRRKQRKLSFICLAERNLSSRPMYKTVVLHSMHLQRERERERERGREIEREREIEIEMGGGELSGQGQNH